MFVAFVNNTISPRSGEMLDAAPFELVYYTNGPSPGRGAILVTFDKHCTSSGFLRRGC